MVGDRTKARNPPDCLQPGARPCHNVTRGDDVRTFRRSNGRAFGRPNASLNPPVNPWHENT